MQFTLVADNQRSVLIGLLIRNLAAVKASAYLTIRMLETDLEIREDHANRYERDFKQMTNEILQDVYENFGHIDTSHIFTDDNDIPATDK